MVFCPPYLFFYFLLEYGIYFTPDFVATQLVHETRTNSNALRRTRYSNEFYTLCDELDIVKMIKIVRTRWLGHLLRMQELGPFRKRTVLESEGTGLVGKLGDLD
jgi:hypothetical protein